MKITFKAFLILGIIFCSLFDGIAQTKAQREQIIKNYDLIELEKLKTEFENTYFQNKAQANSLAQRNNWALKIKTPDGGYSELQGVFPNGNPIYYTLNNRGAARTIRANHLNSLGSLGLDINGENMIVGVWDGSAIRSTHADFEGRAIHKDGVAFGVFDDNSDHATHVTGTIIAGASNGGITIRGAAYQATAWANDWNSDTSELIAQAAEGLLVSNHSYGLQAEFLEFWQFGSYISSSRQWDQIAFNAPYLQIVKSAGNDRNGTFGPGKGGYDLITGVGVSKNVITVGAVENVANYTGPETVVMSAFSNWGPTDDGRVKPDIVARGVGVKSTSSFNDTANSTKSGTSMSAPSVSSGLLLLQELYNDVNGSFMRAATLRGLAIHTVSEAGANDGPDAKFGWGLLDLRTAALAITGEGTTSMIEEKVLNQGETFSINVSGNGGTLQATLAWTDPAGPVTNNGTADQNTPALVNDLDIKITKDGTEYFPWKLNAALYSNPATKGNNVVDNVEKVEILNSPIGEYTITVNHKGTLTGGLQNYSLIVSGIDANLANNDYAFSTFAVWPNPANDQLYVSLQSEYSDEYTIEIFDLVGKKSVHRVIPNSSALETHIDIADLPSGIYLVKVSQGTTFETKKIVKK